MTYAENKEIEQNNVFDLEGQVLTSLTIRVCRNEIRQEFPFHVSENSY